MLTTIDRSKLALCPLCSMTTLDAMLDLGILRLASRISELKKAGVPIRRDWAKVTNRHGETCNVLRYSLDKPGGEE